MSNKQTNLSNNLSNNYLLSLSRNDTCLHHPNALPSIKDLLVTPPQPQHDSFNPSSSTNQRTTVSNNHHGHTTHNSNNSSNGYGSMHVVTTMDTLKSNQRPSQMPPVLQPSQISHVISAPPFAHPQSCVVQQQHSKKSQHHQAVTSSNMETKIVSNNNNRTMEHGTNNYHSHANAHNNANNGIPDNSHNGKDNNGYMHHHHHEISNNMQQQQHMNNSQSQLEFINLERKCDQQMLIIGQLQLENKQLKDEIAQLKRKRDEGMQETTTPTKRKISNSSNNNNNTPSSSNAAGCITFSSMAFDESSSDHSEIDPSQMVVNWNSKIYYLVGAFKAISSRTRVLVNFVPMFEKEHPDKECKIVLTSEEFKRLAKENPHLFKQSKHTWRISLFSSDFYQYVKSKTGH